MKKKDLWQTVLAEIQIEISQANYNAWFKPTKILKKEKLSKERQIITIAVPNRYTKDKIESRYFGQLQEILNRICKKKTEIKFVIKNIQTSKKKQKEPLFEVDFEKDKQKKYRKTVIESKLRPEFTFESFAVSSTNEVAHAAAKAVAQNPGKMYNLLFLYGGVGVGKTHLTHAIGHEVLKKDPFSSIIYCTSEEFTNGIVEAIRNKSTRKFRHKYRSVKALLIDDIQFIGGKDAVQEEFFHTFNSVHSTGGQIVLTSDKLPHEIKGLEDRLCSRFEGGLTIDVQAPDFELRTAILLIKGQQQKVEIPIEVAKLIAENIKSTRKLEGFLTRIITESKTRKEPISEELCKKIFKKTASVNTIKTTVSIKPKKILKKVAQYYQIKISQIKGPRRKKAIVFPRQVAMFLIRQELETPYMEIGDLFGGRDHTTVMHAEDKIKKLTKNSSSLKNDLKKIKKQLYTQ